MINRFIKVAVLAITIIHSQLYAQISPPEVVVTDRAGVNIASGVPVFKINDLKIGAGQLSLNHSISSYAGYFYGYHDVFTGGINNNDLLRDLEVIKVKQVTLDGSTKSFKILDNGTYEDWKEEGETLEELDDYKHRYVRKDGTVAIFNGLFLEKVTYPNGFSYSVDRNLYRIKAVTSNNGLQMKWFYARNTPPTPPSSNDEYSRKIYERENWKYNFPTHIIAYNLASDYCAANATICNFTLDWPSSHYIWDAGMPDAIYDERTDFTVTDMRGEKKTYSHELFDRNHPSSLSYGQYFEPRVNNVKHNGNDQRIYEYENRNTCTSTPPLGRYCRVAYIGELKRATLYGMSTDNSWSYSLNQNGSAYGYGINNSSMGTDGIYYRKDSYYGVPWHIGNNSTIYYFEVNDRNRLSRSETDSIISQYDYDERGNITQRSFKAASNSDDAGDTIITKAGYTTNCIVRKTCNKPLWTEDAKGNRTDYVYHPQSGQIARVTYPANESGTRPQTRYNYSQKYARYNNSAGTMAKATSPIWMLTTESYCISGAANAPATGVSTVTGCKNANDEVITTYEYGTSNLPNNLYMTSKIVTSKGESLRTCYEYDVYGNNIGETLPKGAGASCN